MRSALFAIACAAGSSFLGPPIARADEETQQEILRTLRQIRDELRVIRRELRELRAPASGMASGSKSYAEWFLRRFSDYVDRRRELTPKQTAARLCSPTDPAIATVAPATAHRASSAPQ